jgi:hypothetical protein
MSIQILADNFVGNPEQFYSLVIVESQYARLARPYP